MSLPKIRLERCDRRSDNTWKLDSSQERHLVKALRTYEGAVVEGLLAEGEGKRLLLRLQRHEDGYLLKEFEGAGDAHEERGEALLVSLLIGLLKADQFEPLLRACAELGVRTIHPLICERSVPRIETQDLEKKMSRWRRILDEGSKVSGGIFPPVLSEPVPFSAFDWSVLPGERYAAMLTSGTFPISRAHAVDTEIAFAVGPEGDWTAAEAATLLANDFHPVGLGRRILRASTAAVTACSWFLFQAIQSDDPC